MHCSRISCQTAFRVIQFQRRTLALLKGDRSWLDNSLRTKIRKGSTLSTMSGEPKNPVTDDKDLQMIHEGKASIYQPSSVFYNPVQEFNRDLTIAIITEFAKDHIKAKEEKLKKKLLEKENVGSDKEVTGTNNTDESVNADCTESMEVGKEKKIADDSSKLVAGKSHENGVRILEGLAASGLRSVRFGLEIPGVKEIVANDFDSHAAKIIEKNIAVNNLEGLVVASEADAALLMYQNKQFAKRFDVIDLDPYGSAAPFLDSAVQAVQHGGLLCITCTDAAILCGNFGETCYAKYGSLSLRTPCCHEMAVRIILKSIDSHANRYGRYVVPLLTLSVDFYFRLFLKVYNGPSKAKDSICKTANVYHCSGCGSFEFQKFGVRHEAKGGSFKYTPATGPPITEKCTHCGFKHHIGGPISIASLHDKQFIERIIGSVREDPERFSTSKRIEGMLTMVLEELDVPLYYVADELFNVVHCTPPTMVDIRSAIFNAGYQVSYSPFHKNSLKTDAPNQVIWDIMRAWVKKNPVNPKRLTAGSPAKAILDQEPSIEVSFDIHPDAKPKSMEMKLVRFQVNPERDWGPKPKAKKSTEKLEDKRLQNQGKRKRKAEAIEDEEVQASKQ